MSSGRGPPACFRSGDLYAAGLFDRIICNVKSWVLSLRRLAGAVFLLVLCAISGLRTVQANEGQGSAIELEPPPSRREPVLTMQDFKGSWEYRYGDCPKDVRGIPLWAVLPSQEGWHPLTTLQTPPERNGQRFLWMRTKLTGPLVSDPTLALEIVDQIFEAYLDGQMIYRFGKLDGQDAESRRFLGYPTHYIPLSENTETSGDYRGKTLTLRIYSAHINIGVFGKVRIGTRSKLLTALIQEDAGRVAVGIVLCAVGLFVLMLFLYERSDRAYMFYAWFTFSTGLWTLCQTKMRGELSVSPLRFTYVELFSLYMAVTGLMLYLERVMGRGPFGISRLIARVLVVYDLCAAVLIGVGAVTLLQTLLPFQIMLLVTVVYTLAIVVASILKGDSDAKLFGLGLAAASTLVAYDVLAAVGIVPRVSLASSYMGQALFVLAIGLILVRRFRQVHLNLIHAKNALSEQVGALESRNSEIELLNSELRHQIEARSRALVESLLGSDHAVPVEQSVLSVGAIINKRYRVLNVLGQGAMGIVYEVERLSDKRHFAAKVLASHAGRESLARFVREAQLLAHLDHPHLVTITDVDITEDRVAYIVMELVTGTTLAQQHHRFRDLDFAIPVLRQVADALSKVHAEGVVHRDLKPAKHDPVVNRCGNALARMGVGGNPVGLPKPSFRMIPIWETSRLPLFTANRVCTMP